MIDILFLAYPIGAAFVFWRYSGISEVLLDRLAMRATKKRTPRKTMALRRMEKLQRFAKYLLDNLSRRWPFLSWWLREDSDGVQIFARKSDGTTTAVMSLYTDKESILSPYYLSGANHWNKTHAWTLLGLSSQINRLTNMDDFSEFVGKK